jgi:hypothetical protein
VLEILKRKQVFSVELSGDKRRLEITEECDQYYSYVLTKAEVMELVKEFNDLAKQMGE